MRKLLTSFVILSTLFAFSAPASANGKVCKTASGAPAGSSFNAVTGELKCGTSLGTSQPEKIPGISGQAFSRDTTAPETRPFFGPAFFIGILFGLHLMRSKRDSPLAPG